MSEIIGSVYDLMRDTGKTEGILFLDEINCVSETRAVHAAIFAVQRCSASTAFRQAGYS